MTKHHVEDIPVGWHDVRVLTAISQQAHLNALLGRRAKHRDGNPFDRRPAMWRRWAGFGVLEPIWELRR